MSSLRISPPGLFNPDLAKLDHLETLTVGRGVHLDGLTRALSAWVGGQLGRHLLITGPSGSGKSHLLALLELAITRDPSLSQALLPLRLPALRYRVLNFEAFIGSLLSALDQKDGFHRAAEPKQTNIAQLQARLKATGKRLLLLIENLDTLCLDQLKAPRESSALHAFLVSQHECMVVASALDAERLPKSLRPLFSQHPVGPLSCQDALLLVRTRLERDAPQRLGHFSEIAPQLLALLRISGRQARTVGLLHNLVAHENTGDPAQLLALLLDRTTAEHRAAMSSLPPQERAVLETLALLDARVRTPGAIAAALGMKSSQLSSLLRRLSVAGVLRSREVASDKRSRLYAFEEGLLEIWLAWGASTEARHRVLRLLEVLYQNACDNAGRPAPDTLPAATPRLPALSARPGAPSFIANETFFRADMEAMVACWENDRQGDLNALLDFLNSADCTFGFTAWAQFRERQLMQQLKMEQLALERAGILVLAASLLSDIAALPRAKLHLEQARRELDNAELSATALQGIVLNDLAVLLKNTEHPAEAEPLIQRSCEILLGAKGPGGLRHPSLGTALRNYHAILRKLGWDEEQAFATVSALEQQN